MQVAVCQCRTQSHRPAVSVAHSHADPLLQRLKAHTYTHTPTHTHPHALRASLPSSLSLYSRAFLSTLELKKQGGARVAFMGAVRCCVPQCAVVCCSVLQCVAVCCSVSQCVAVCCSVLQCAAVCCSVLQCVAACCRLLSRSRSRKE